MRSGKPGAGAESQRRELGRKTSGKGENENDKGKWRREEGQNVLSCNFLYIKVGLKNTFSKPHNTAKWIEMT